MPSRHFLRSDYLHIFFYIKFLVFVSLVHQISSYKLEYPIRAVSTSLAQSRPSRIAHTTSDCPRCISPAVKTLSTFVLKCPASVFTFVRSVRSKPKAYVTYGWLPKNPAAINTKSTGTSYSLPATSAMMFLPAFLSNLLSSLTSFALQTSPFSLAMNSFTVV